LRPFPLKISWRVLPPLSYIILHTKIDYLQRQMSNDYLIASSITISQIVQIYGIPPAHLLTRPNHPTRTHSYHVKSPPYLKCSGEACPRQALTPLAISFLKPSHSTPHISKTTREYADNLTSIRLRQHLDASNPFDPLKAAAARSNQAQGKPMLMRE
jgi:hypothetical protein